MSLTMKVVKARKAGMFSGGGPMMNVRAANGAARYGGPMMYSRGRAGQQGGIFGDIVGVLGKAASFIPVVGPVLGAGLGAASSALNKTKSGVTAGIQPQTNVANFAPTGPGMGAFPGMPTLMPTPNYAPENVPVSTSSGPGTAVARCAPSGYHLNKSGYWANESHLLPGASWVAPGTKMVRNRKRNPYNPKAASRAMSRLAALSAGMKSLERQLTKLAPKRRAAPRCGPKCKK